MNWYQIFYWLTVADNARIFFGWMCALFTIVAVFSTIFYFASLQDDAEFAEKVSSKWVKYSYPFMILFWSLLILTPSKKDSLLIIAGGGTIEFLTSDSTAKKIPGEMSNFVLTEIKNMAKEAEVELDVKTAKEKVLEEAKQMTSEELINKISADSNFAKIILNK